MSRSGNILVFDVGTSALKAVLFDENGAVLVSGEAQYQGSSSPHRQSPQEWWRACVTACNNLKGENVGAIALTGTMENLAPLSADGTPLGDALLYSNPCGAGAHAAFEKSNFGAERFSAIAGNAAEPLMSVFKLAWLRENEPARYRSAHGFLPGAKDFLALKMTGVAATDAVCAATTGLMDLTTRDWSVKLLEYFDVERKKLPEILPANEIIGVLGEESAGELGLEAGIPIINGCGDAGATTLGSGAKKSGDISLYLGTSGWVARVSPMQNTLEPRPFYCLPHPLEQAVIEIAPVLSAGGATNWARKALGLDLAEAEKLALEADQLPGAAVFLPYLSGERFPFVDLNLRAGFFNICANDGPGALYYAVLEGVALSIRANVEAMGGFDKGEGVVSLVGGGALSKIWPLIIADVLGVAIEIPSDPLFATSLGAFRIARQALGQPDPGMKKSTLVHPRLDRAERMARQIERFERATIFARSLS
jgi:xylulokinase